MLADGNHRGVASTSPGPRLLLTRRLDLPEDQLMVFDGPCDGQVTLPRQDQAQADAEDLVTRREDT
jgi:hypothetical protein